VRRRSVGGGREPGVAAAAAAAAGDDKALTTFHQFADPLGVGVCPDDRAGRHEDDHVTGVLAVRLAAHAAAAGCRAELALALEVAEGRHAGLDDEDDIAALAAVAAVGTAARDMRLAPHGGGPIATRSAGHQDSCAISEHQDRG
jgi:hypothetical protein